MTQRKIRGGIAIVLMMSMMSVISSLYTLKIFLLGILLLLCFKDSMVCKHNKLLCSFLCCSTILGIIVGLLRGAEHPFSGITTGFFWPILSLIIVTPLLRTKDDYRVLVKWMFIMHSFLILYDLLLAANVMFGVPIINLYPETKTVFSIYGTTSRMNLINLNTLTFTTPLFFLLYLTRFDFGVNNKIQFMILLLNMFLLIISGRRSLMLVFFLIPFFTILFSGFFSRDTIKTTKKMLALIIAIIICFLFYVYSSMPEVFEGYLHTFTKAFDSSEEPVRFNQAKMLMGHFEEHPIFGWGSGTEFYEADRGIKQHQFELTYLLVLAHGGIVGFVLYILGTVGVLFVGIRYAKIRKDVLFVCILFAFFFVLIADATNPVLCSFDLMLPLFLCYAKINSCAFNFDDIQKV